MIAAYEAKYSERSTAKYCLFIDSVFNEQPVTKPDNHDGNNDDGDNDYAIDDKKDNNIKDNNV